MGAVNEAIDRLQGRGERAVVVHSQEGNIERHRKFAQCGRRDTDSRIRTGEQTKPSRAGPGRILSRGRLYAWVERIQHAYAAGHIGAVIYQGTARAGRTKGVGKAELKWHDRGLTFRYEYAAGFEQPEVRSGITYRTPQLPSRIERIVCVDTVGLCLGAGFLEP